MGIQKINAAKQTTMAKRDLDITHCTKQPSVRNETRRRKHAIVTGMKPS
jgi:hypothetical protein